MTVKILSTDSRFPDVSEALQEPNGLLAIGGDLSTERLITAYRQGIFPWFTENQPILWWSPDPRAVLWLDEIKVARSLKKIIRHGKYEVSLDYAFDQVIAACAKPRKKQSGTWITPQMQAAYNQLHQQGLAHSIEVWDGEENMLIGGLYGIDCGQIFTGESMFSVQPNAAKIALVYLADFLKQQHYRLIDCQIGNPFLQQFGTRCIPRAEFIQLLTKGYNSNEKYWQKQLLRRVSL